MRMIASTENHSVRLAFSACLIGAQLINPFWWRRAGHGQPTSGAIS